MDQVYFPLHLAPVSREILTGRLILTLAAKSAAARPARIKCEYSAYSMVLDEAKTGALSDVDVNTIELTNVTAGAIGGKFGTRYDQRDMVRMGKRQELRRNFQFFSIFGYAVILGCTWEWGLASGVFSLTNGGTAGAIWMFLAVCFGMFFVMLSMAEMASIAPTSGGQYRAHALPDVLG